MKQLRPITRILLALAALAMVSGFFLPMWQIQLWAPQYPEGLNMKIWLNHLSGDFAIINGLNHYIGMREIKQEMFPEFHYMVGVLAFLIAAGMVPVLFGKRRWLILFVALLFLSAGLGIYDFHRWSHDYGHNLNPHAAISVPGMTYDPPLVGYKALLNFIAYSGPDSGGWALIGSGAMATCLLLWETLRGRKRNAAAPAAVAASMILSSCHADPQPIYYGADACTGCSMTLADRHFGAEFITGKGKVFKFDDINCLVRYLHDEPAESDKAGRVVVIDFNHAARFLKANEAVFLQHKGLHTPMGSHTGAFDSKSAAEAVNAKLGGGGKIMPWSETLNSF